MRKTYIAFAVLSMAALLVSCQNNEFSEDMYVPEKGEIVFRLANDGKATKASDATVKGAVMDLGTADGTKLVLEESITYLDQRAYSPETKGTPAYTENFTELYGDFKAAAFKSNNGTFETTAFDDGVYEKVSGVEIDIWKRKYANLDSSLPLYFFLRAPYTNESTTAGVGKVSGLTYYPTAQTVDGKTYAAGSISFSYTSPATAIAQEDLLFTSRKLEQSEYEAFQNKNEGIPVLFHHALTGVKFAIANPDGGFNDGEDHKIAITKVEFTGLVNSGSCVITPRQETNGYVDDRTGDHSSGHSAGEGKPKTTVWTLGSGTGTFSQEFGPDDFVEAYEQGTGKKFKINGEYPSTFAAAGNENNVNDDDATKTFWFIPQAMTDNVILTVTFEIDEETQPEVSINFGTALSGVTWEAGELRTYTLRIDDVNVKIEDTVEPTSTLDATLLDDNNQPIKDKDGNPYKYTYYGGTKSGVTITNTGNTDAFIRAALIGQWLDENGNPVFGYTDFTHETVVVVDSWYEDQFVTKADADAPARKHGTFTGLVGYDNTYPAEGVDGHWVYKDGYYYYTLALKPGESVPQNDPLFRSYEVKKNPAVIVGGVVKDVYFRLEIATQAISAKKQDGTSYGWEAAWDNAEDQQNN